MKIVFECQKRQLLNFMVPVIFVLCGCHDNPLLYRTVAQTLLLWTNELTVDSGLFVQLNFLKYTKCSIGVLFLLFKSKLWAQCDGRRAGILETLETIAFASLWRGRVKRLLTKWKHQFHSNVFLNAKYSSFLPLWRTSFYSECCHKNKLLLFFLLSGYCYKNKQQRCKLCLVFSA